MFWPKSTKSRGKKPDLFDDSSDLESENQFN